MAVTVWSAGTACLAAVCALGSPLTAQETTGSKSVFEGTARNSVTRAGIAKVSIRLIPRNGSIGYEGTTNRSGIFHFESVVPGDYQVEASRTGFDSKWVLSDKAGHAISTLHLAAGQSVSGSNLWFAPESEISGKVIGTDGEPIPDAHVTLIKQVWKDGRRTYEGVTTERADDAGVFHCTEILAGRYFAYAARPHQGPLAFSILEGPGKPEMRIAGRYYPNAVALDGAGAIDVRPGEQISGIDIKLPLVPAFHLTGSATPPATADSASVRLKRRFNEQKLDWEEESAPIHKDGSFDLEGVTPGTYFLTAIQTFTLEPSFNAVSGPKVEVTMSAENKSGVIAPPPVRFDIKGRVSVEGGTAGERIAVEIYFEGSEADEYTSFRRRARPDAEGAFAITGLTPDRYAVRIADVDTGKDGGYYLKTVRVNGVDLPDGEIDMSKGPAANVELILSSGVGSVEGSVVWPEARPAADAVPEPPGDLTVLLIPQKVASGSTRAATAYLDQDGHFHLTDLEPGTYRAFAVTNYDKGLWQNGEFRRQVASHGVTVEVTDKAGAHAEVSVLTAADVRTVEERIQ